MYYFTLYNKTTGEYLLDPFWGRKRNVPKLFPSLSEAVRAWEGELRFHKARKRHWIPEEWIIRTVSLMVSVEETYEQAKQNIAETL